MSRPARKQIAAGTANHVIINDGVGNLSSEAALAITRGGSGQTTANAALNAFLPSQTTNGGKFLQTDGTNTSWQSPASAGTNTSSYQITNLGISTSVAANALTINVTDSAGGTPSASSPVTIGFRSSTTSSGVYNVRSQTSALSLTVPSTVTLGTNSGLEAWIWVYALELDATTIELAVSLGRFDERTVQNTAAISGGTLAGGLYSSAARSQKPIRLIGRIKITEATAGTWITNSSEIAVEPLETIQIPTTVQRFLSGSGTGATACKIRTNPFPRLIKVYMAGQGGGGSGGGTTAGGAATAGSNSTFGTAFLTAGGGPAGVYGNAGAAGGSITVNSPAINIRSKVGNTGCGYVAANSGTVLALVGGFGGETPFFGGGGKASQAAQNGTAGGTNSGGGGQAGGTSAAVNSIPGSGGGSGGYLEIAITAANGLLSSYDYVVGDAAGAGGTNGTSGQSGAAGGTGIIIVEEID